MSVNIFTVVMGDTQTNVQLLEWNPNRLALWCQADEQDSTFLYNGQLRSSTLELPSQLVPGQYPYPFNGLPAPFRASWLLDGELVWGPINAYGAFATWAVCEWLGTPGLDPQVLRPNVTIFDQGLAGVSGLAGVATIGGSRKKPRDHLEITVETICGLREMMERYDASRNV